VLAWGKLVHGLLLAGELTGEPEQKSLLISTFDAVSITVIRRWADRGFGDFVGENGPRTVTGDRFASCCDPSTTDRRRSS
jgi:hypothetical protein